MMYLVPTEQSRRRSIQIDKFGDWVQMEDPLEKRKYYHNGRTGELTYDQPEEWSSYAATEAATTDSNLVCDQVRHRYQRKM